MLNKKRIFGIGLFVIVAFFMYTFANPSQKVEEDQKDNASEEITETVESDETDNEVVEQIPVNTPISAVIHQQLPNTIVNNPLIVGNTTEELDLTIDKDAAKKELRVYADSMKIVEPYLVTLNELVSNGGKNIDKSTSKEMINKSLADAKKEILEFKEKIDLNTYKNQLIEELNQYYDGLKFNDSLDELSVSKEELSNGISSIDDAINKEDSLKEFNNSKINLDKLKEIELLISYKNSKEFNAEFNDEANNIVSINIININNGVEDALKNAKIALDELEIAQKLSEEKVKAIMELNAYKESLQFTTEFLTKSDGANFIVASETLIINSITNKSDISGELDNAKKLLDDLKAIEQKPANIILNGDSLITLVKKLLGNNKYIDQGVSVISNSNYTLSTTMTFTEPYGVKGTSIGNTNIDFGSNAKIGTYVITYEVTNASGKTTLSRTIIVKRLLDEIISNNDISIIFTDEKAEVCATEYCKKPNIDYTVKAHDYVNGKLFNYTDITSRIIEVSNNVDTTKVGNYQVVYSVTDWTGEVITKTKKVKIVDTTKPVINLTGVMQNVIIQGVNVQIPVAVVTDNYDKNMTYTYSYNFSYSYKIFSTKKQAYLKSVEYKAIDSFKNETNYTYTLPTEIFIKEIGLLEFL